MAHAFARAGLQATILVTDGPGHATTLAEAARREGYAVVVAAGGDGTVSEVVNGLARRPPGHPLPDSRDPAATLGILPTGSGNDFAQVLGIPRNLERAVEIIARGQVRRLDLGVAELLTAQGFDRRTFNNNLGIGLEAAVTLESYRIRRLQGLPLYLWAAVRTLQRYRAPSMAVTVHDDGGGVWRRTAPTLMVTVGNTRRAGGGFHLTPHAEPDDGYLDVGVAAALPAWRVALLLPRALWGGHANSPAVTMLRCARLAVAGPDGFPVQLDGEVVEHPATAVEISLRRRALVVLTPTGK